MANIGPTKSERQAVIVAEKLIAALLAIESFQDDPEMIFAEPVTITNLGAAEAWLLLKRHYLGDEDNA